MLSLLTLIIDSILIPFENSINAQALQHESAMVDVYTKMKPDSFKLQLQAVLTAFYEDIKGVQGASGCPKIKVIKRRFADQDEVEDVDGAAAAYSSKEPDAVAAAAPAAAAVAAAAAPAAAAAAAAAEAAPDNTMDEAAAPPGKRAGGS